MWLLISRKFALVCILFGLAILCSGCINSIASNTSAAKIPTSDKKVIPTSTLTLYNRINARPTATPSRAARSQSIAPADIRYAVTTTPSQSHKPLSLLLACSAPTAKDGFSVTNTHARACVYTTPGAILTISVHFCNGKADPSQALQRNAIAGANGFYEWNWTPVADCHARHVWGWNVNVTAQIPGDSTSISAMSSTSSSITTSSSSSSSSFGSP